jgi:murein DD-endopeptidase MepM/ murein hydrolase activator NlpD
MVFLQANWTTSGLTPSDSYVVGFSVDGVRLDSATLTGQVGDNLPYYWWLGGWYASTGVHNVSITVDANHTVSGADESSATKSFTFSPQAPTSLPARFLNPMGTVSNDWTIVNYVDANPLSSANNDYLGGQFTYDGHSGMDMTLADFPLMDAGHPAYAAAAGTVVQVQDGNFDRNNTNNNNPANFIVIDNGNNWQTIYYHVMSGSIAVKVGEHVSAGQMIALMGSSGNSTDAHLHFEVHHDGDVVETNYDPSSYWVTPFTYEGNVAPYAMDAGVTDYAPSGDAQERPVDVSTFPTSATGTSVWYWYRLSHIDPNSVVQVHWYRPDGTIATTYGYTQSSSTDRFGFYNWVLPYSTWSGASGVWHVAVSVNGVEMGKEAFTVTPGVGLAALRLTLGTTSGTYIVNGRTTPIDFGSAPAGAAGPLLSFTVQNVGLAPMTLGNPVLPQGFALVGGFPSSLEPNASATFSVQMSTAAAGAQFGRMSFSSSAPGASTFGFNLSGTVTGSPPAGAPTVTFGDAAAVFLYQTGPVPIDPDIVLNDGPPGDVSTGVYTVRFASGATMADHLGLANEGTGPGQVNVSGTSVLYGGTAVGSVSGGNGLAPLVVAYQGASIDAAEAVARDVMFRTDVPLTTQPRYVSASLIDSAGLTSESAIKKVEVDFGTRGLTLSPATQSIVEGGGGSFSLVLDAQPVSDVTVTLSAPPTLNLGTTTVTFTPTNWNTPVLVAIRSDSPGVGGTTATINAQVTATTDPAYVGLAAAPIAISFTQATRLQVTTEPPSSVHAGAGFGLYVSAEDSLGRVDTLVDGTVTLALGNNPSGGSLSGQTSVVLVQGVAWFTNVVLGTPGYGYTLVTSSGTLTPDTTTPINVNLFSPSVSLGVSLPSPTFGQAETLTASVTATGATPGGWIAFVDGTTTLGSVLLSAGVASLTTSLLGAGSHTIFADYSGDPVTAPAAASVSLEVARAHLTVTADDRSRTYGAYTALTATITGFVNGDTPSDVSGLPTLATSATARSGVGSYPITVLAGTLSAANYDFPSLVYGTLTVNPAPLTVTAASVTRLVGQPNPPLPATYSGFVNGDTTASLTRLPMLSTAAVPSSPAGTYAIVAGGAASPNYTITYIDGTLTVLPALVTVSSESVQGLHTGRRRSTVIFIHFSDALDAASAQTIQNYSLTTIPPTKKQVAKAVRLAGASYNSATHTVMLTLAKPLVPITPLQLLVRGSGVLDALGRPIDGNHDGVAGGDSAAILRRGVGGRR